MQLADEWSAATGQQKRFITYEAGQGLNTRNPNNPFNSIFYQAQYDPRMYDMYIQIMTALKQSGGDLFMHFTYLSRYDQWGYWGAREWIDQTEEDSPKLQALLDFNRHFNQSVKRNLLYIIARLR
jgi:hypothetical protein